MADWFRTRVPLTPEDAEYYRDVYNTAATDSERMRQNAFAMEMDRLALIAAAKRNAEREMGRASKTRYGIGVDQEEALRFGMRVADQAGFGEPLGHAVGRGLADASAWAYSSPDSRHVVAQAARVPYDAALHTIAAFSSPEAGGPKTAGEFGGRLATALPAAFFPEVGYPLHGAEQELFRWAEDNPISAGVLMPKVNEWSPVMSAASSASRAAGRGVDAIRYGRGIPTYLETSSGELIRRLPSTDPAYRVRRLLLPAP